MKIKRAIRQCIAIISLSFAVLRYYYYLLCREKYIPAQSKEWSIS